MERKQSWQKKTISYYKRRKKWTYFGFLIPKTFSCFMIDRFFSFLYLNMDEFIEDPFQASS